MATDNKIGIIYIPLEDLESEHCVLIVDKGLAQVKELLPLKTVKRIAEKTQII